MPHYEDFMKGLGEAKLFAKEKGLSFFIYDGQVYIEDGGSRAWACPGDCTFEGDHYTSAFGMSHREAKDSEIEMWAALGGPT